MRKYKNKETGEIVNMGSTYHGDNHELIFFTDKGKCTLEVLREKFEPIDQITNFIERGI